MAEGKIKDSKTYLITFEQSLYPIKMVRFLEEKELVIFHKLFSTILREGFPEYPVPLIDFFINNDFSVDSLGKMISEKEISILIDEEVSGFVGFLLFEKLYGGVSYCAWIGILKEMRGRGIGRKLVEEWEKQILLEGGHRLTLITQSQTNRQIFPRFGFKEEGLEEKSWFGLDAWIFGKVISEPKIENYINYQII